MGGAGEMGGPATWVWGVTDAEAAVAFAAGRGVTEAFLGVGWPAPDDATLAFAERWRTAGIRVAALGGSPEWTDRPELAAQWAERTTSSWAFDRVHLDIEPWVRRPLRDVLDGRLGGLAEAVRRVRAVTPLAVEVDLVPWLATKHPARFREVMVAASAVSLLAYRDRAPAILEWSRVARTVASETNRRYRIAVDTRPPTEGPGTSFAGQGERTMQRELDAVTAVLSTDPLFAGVAVHDVAHWHTLAVP